MTEKNKPSNKIPNERTALLCGLLAVCLWSTVATAFKLGLQHLSVIQLLWLGTIFSWLVFTIYLLVRGIFLRGNLVRRGISWEQNTLRHAIIFGSLNPTAYYLILFEAYDRLPAHIAQPLNYTWALTLALLAIPLLRQPLTQRMLIGIIISYTGVVLLLVTAHVPTNQPLSVTGIALALASTIIWAIYWILNTRWHHEPASMMWMSFSWALLPLTGLLLWQDELPALTARTLGYGAWVGAIEMGITFLLWQYALSKTQNVARMGQLIFISPFLSLIFINQVLGEAIHPLAVVALVIIVAGLFFGQSKQPTS